MSQQKEELHGVITLGMNVKSTDGVLTKGAKVKISGDMEVQEIDTAQDYVFGYLLIPNREAGGACTVVTRLKRVNDETSGAAFSAGDFLNFDADGKAIKAAAAAASGTITISDYSAVDAGDTVTVNGIVLTAGGTDWTAATSNAVTAQSLRDAINDKVPGVLATANSGVVTVTAVSPGVAGNSIALATSMTVNTEGTVSGSTLTGGAEFLPFGIALETAADADETVSVGWFV